MKYRRLFARDNGRARGRLPFRRRLAAALGAVLLVTGMGAGGVQAAPTAPQVEETMYVNLDYYGKTSKISVVKGCSLNGGTQFTDYGSYQDVINMSNDAAPQMGDGSLTWSFEESPATRFYYQCVMDQGQVTLPWDLDVSYKLNGVPKNGDELAGAKGLVEIHIQATPNEGAREYYRNNMILMAMVPVDRSECYSVEAEGSQSQSLGDTMAVVFTALPGEEGDFTVRIGTDSFETTGVIMAMVPGTVEDLEHIKDLKEAKDTWRQAGDELYDSMDEMAEAAEGMESGLKSLQSGAASAEAGRQVLSGAKDAILAGNDETLAALSAMNRQMETMAPHLESAKEQAEIVHDGMNGIVGAMGEMQEPLRKLYTRLKHIQNESDSLASELPEIQELAVQIIALDAKLQANEQVVLTGMGDFAAAMEEVDALYYEDEFEEEEEDDARKEDDGAENGKQESGQGEGQEGSQGGSSHTASPSLAQKSENRATISSRQYQLLGASMGEILSLLQQKAALLTETAEKSAKLTDTLSDMAGDISDSAKYSRDLVDSLDLTIEEVVSLKDALDVYYPELQSSLSDAKELVNRTTEAMDSAINTMTLLQNALKDSSDFLDAAARDSLRGSMEVLDQSLKALDSVTAMRQAGQTMKDTMDRELDRFEEENRFLYIDPSAPKVSFTSDKNPEPETIQILLRTQEISLEDEAHQLMDAETQEQGEVNPLKRMWDVLVKIWQAVVEIFKGR